MKKLHIRSIPVIMIQSLRIHFCFSCIQFNGVFLQSGFKFEDDVVTGAEAGDEAGARAGAGSGF